MIAGGAEEYDVSHFVDVDIGEHSTHVDEAVVWHFGECVDGNVVVGCR